MFGKPDTHPDFTSKIKDSSPQLSNYGSQTFTLPVFKTNQTYELDDHGRRMYTKDQVEKLFDEYYKRNPPVEQRKPLQPPVFPTSGDLDKIADETFRDNSPTVKTEKKEYTGSVEWTTEPILVTTNNQVTKDNSQSTAPFMKTNQTTLNNSPAASAGSQAAREYLNQLVDDYYSKFTPQHKLIDKRDAELASNNAGTDIVNLADIAIAGSKGFTDATQDFGGADGAKAFFDFWALDGTARTLYNMYGPDPVLRDTLNYGKDEKNRQIQDKYNKKISFLNDSDYKFLISSPDDIYRNSDRSPKYNFLKTITNKVNELSALTPDYGREEDNQKYKEAYLSYLKSVLKMNNDNSIYSRMNIDLENIP
jgi:hypothetical protein